ncbi:N-acetylglucosaminyldiphosphodolichol N-acetylglucosaminyltransferase catalytic subunit alg13 [Agyrium rufum]|nr:N-acetylglucosaminyldiphosphodolichol N-acetylglucosaminyltransferase catalytic subunit alg13 [Agyrium rufum]
MEKKTTESGRDNQSGKKTCFVTIGATADFSILIEASLTPQFLEALGDAGYTDLLLQYGRGGRVMIENFDASYGPSDPRRRGLKINGFAFNDRGLGAEMRAAKGENGNREGVVISHAGTPGVDFQILYSISEDLAHRVTGSGSILEALRIGVPIVVVPNPSLLDNHQWDLAVALSKQGYVDFGEITELETSIAWIERDRKDRKPWPPVEGKADPSGKGLIGVMDDMLGFVD